MFIGFTWSDHKFSWVLTRIGGFKGFLFSIHVGWVERAETGEAVFFEADAADTEKARKARGAKGYPYYIPGQSTCAKLLLKIRNSNNMQ